MNNILIDLLRVPLCGPFLPMFMDRPQNQLQSEKKKVYFYLMALYSRYQVEDATTRTVKV